MSGSFVRLAAGRPNLHVDASRSPCPDRLGIRREVPVPVLAMLAWTGLARQEGDADAAWAYIDICDLKRMGNARSHVVLGVL